MIKLLLLIVVGCSPALVVAQGIPVAPASDREAVAALERDMIAYDPLYRGERLARGTKLRELAERMFAEERKGVKNGCGHQILFEAEEMLVTSAAFKDIDRRLSDLEGAIAHPSGDSQDAEGMWGRCSEEWYLKLYHTYDRLEDEARGRGGQDQPLPEFLNRISTPERLVAYLDGLVISDVRRTGVDRGLEFNQTISILLRMLVLGEPSHYKIEPGLRDALMDRLMHRYRNFKTGFWGERYRRRGREEFQDDLSTTFHVVSFLHGEIPEMDRVVNTTLALKGLDYPAGWLWKGKMWNHNNMDVVTIFKYGWVGASERQRAMMRAEIEQMLKWCLNNSLKADGSFAPNLADASVEEGEYYGTAFLARIGFFDASRRFWTDRQFPEAKEIQARISGFVKAHAEAGAVGDRYRSTLSEMGEK